MVLAMLLIGLAWTAPRAQRVEVSKTVKPKPTLKSIIWPMVRIYIGIFLMLVLAWGINLGWHTYHLYKLAKGLQTDPGQIQAEKILFPGRGGCWGHRHDLRPAQPALPCVQ